MKVQEIIRHEASSNSWTHAYLILGNDKKEAAELVDFFVAKKGCLSTDISVLEPDDEEGKKGEIKAEKLRQLLHDINLSPAGNCRIAIIYNSERLNRSSSNLLLKSLEEPPRNVTFILVASVDSLLPTIKSRCRILKIASPSTREPEKNSRFPLLKKNFQQYSAAVEKIIKDNEIEVFLSELEAGIHQLMLQSREKKFVRALDSVFEVKKSIRRNAAPRLALEALKLELDDIL